MGHRLLGVLWPQPIPRGNGLSVPPFGQSPWSLPVTLTLSPGLSVLVTLSRGLGPHGPLGLEYLPAQCSCRGPLQPLWRMPTDLVALNNTDFFSQSSGGQRPKMSLSGLSAGVGRAGSFQRLLGSPVSGGAASLAPAHRWRLCLRGHTGFSEGQTSLCPSHMVGFLGN